MSTTFGSTPMPSWATDGIVPFGSVYDGPVQDAAASLRPGPGWHRSAISDLCGGLRGQLARLAGPALLALFDEGRDRSAGGAADRVAALPPESTGSRRADQARSSNAPGSRGTGGRFEDKPRRPATATRYRSFVRSLVQSDLSELRSAFPVLSLLIDQSCRQWVTATQELLDRVEHARGRLETDLDLRADAPIVHAVAGLGDRHESGRTVARIETADGGRAIYKPRSLLCEATFFSLIDELHEQIGDPALAPRVVDLGTVGLVEFVDSSVVSDPAVYWRRAGALAGMLHLCGAGDLHAENVVAAATGPIPIDLECIDQPKRLDDRGDRHDHVADSVLATGLFPHRLTDNWAGPMDHAGLFPGLREKPMGEGLFWQALGSDAIARVSVPYTRELDRNVARDGAGRPIGCDVPALLEGLDAAWERGPALLAQVGDWGAVRYLRCSTRVYVEARSSMLELDALADHDLFVERSLDLPVLEDRSGRIDGASGAVVASEAEALRRLDVPIHHAVGHALVPDGGDPIEGFFAVSGRENRERKIARLHPAGRRAQADLVVLAVEQFEASRTSPSAGSENDEAPRSPFAAPAARTMTSDESAIAAPDRIVDAAVDIGRRLLECRLPGLDGDGWLELDHGNPRRGVAHGTGLYSGSDGIALLFAALAAVTGDASWTDACRSALDAEPDPHDERPWFESGWAGRVYARAVCGRLLHDDTLLSAAGSIAEAGPANDPDLEDRIDVLGGWSGVILSLLASLRMGIPVQARVAELAEWLRGELLRRLEHPVLHRSIRRMGMAHGTTGYAFTLARVAATLGDTRAAEMARELAAHEDTRVAERGGMPGSLSGLGATKAPQPSWCWGVAGYAAARSHPDWIEVVGTSAHLATAVEVLSAPVRHRTHLCCGEAGQLMTLDAARTRLPSDKIVAAGDRLAAALVYTADNDGPWHFHPTISIVTPGLFWGTAGVGYALLHHVRPDLVPNILTIDSAAGVSPNR